MVESLKIYLGDLTYNTISLSTEVFPLNIGYIASYCKKQFGDKVDITLFKYIEELENAIENSPPDILGMSNYAWCHRLGLEMFRMALKKNPQLITVWGGPNFPQDIPSQEKFLKSFPEVDVYVPIDGETGFSNVVSFVLESNSKKEIKKKIVFQFSNEQFKLVQDGLDQCGETMVGKSRIFRWIPPNSIWRVPLIEN